MTCSGCGISFPIPYSRINQKRHFHSKQCSDAHPFIRQADPAIMGAAKKDMAAGKTWYESARARKVPLGTMRNVFLRLGYVPGIQRTR